MSTQSIFKKTLILRLFLLLAIVFSCFSLSAQNLKDLDSLLLDRDLKNYSIRVFTNFKVNKFSIKNEDSKARFVPGNRHGIGLGFANRKIILDLAFNLKNPNKEETRKFDLQGTTILKNQHYVNVYAQTYKGFTAKNNFNEPFVFRKDIRSVSIGVNYLYTFDNIEFSYSHLKAGLSQDRNKNVFITGGVGAFTVYDYFSASPSVFSDIESPYFEDHINIKRYQGMSFGVLAGLISYFKLPENITATFNVIPGVALTNKKIILQDDVYRPSNPMLYKLDVLAGVTYNLKQFYVSLTYTNGLYSTSLDKDNRYNLNLTNAKLALGYKIGSSRNH